MLKFEDIDKQIGLEKAEQQFADLLCKVLQVPRSRLEKFKLRDGEIIREGGTLMEYEFNPKLTNEEEEKIALFFRDLSKMYGGRPPVKLEEV